jgi:hypothetical protein
MRLSSPSVISLPGFMRAIAAFLMDMLMGAALLTVATIKFAFLMMPFSSVM